tara:strand:+ start:2130 stop:2297 length:168 start_codon:yes stop_codon:yes gene_type:complete
MSTYIDHRKIDATVTEIYRLLGMQEADPEGVMGVAIARIIQGHLDPPDPELGEDE